MKLEAIKMNSVCYAVKPEGQPGIRGLSPRPWSVVYVDARTPEHAIHLAAPHFSPPMRYTMKLEAVKLRSGYYAVRPEGQLGTHGFSPEPWAVVYVDTSSPEEAILKALPHFRNHREFSEEEKLTMYDRGDYVLKPPPVCSQGWGRLDWIKYIDACRGWRPSYEQEI